MGINISVIICSYNRWQSLAKTLESVAASTVSSSLEWEVLVVDNNSTDRTRELADEFCRRYPNQFRYIFEAQQGKSHALNTGIREARGEVLAFTDDDVTVESTWLENLTANLLGNEWVGAGGRVFPEPGVVFPSWLALNGPHSMAGLLVLLDRGSAACELIEAPFGANMAFRKAMFEKYGGFRTDLGPPPKLRGEDTEFCLRLMKTGERLRYEPSAVVYHAVPADRLKKTYFLSWWFGHGRCMMRLRAKRPPVWGMPSEFFSIGKRIVRSIPHGVRQWMRATDPQGKFFWKCWMWMTVGEIYEFSRQAFEGKRNVVGSVPSKQAAGAEESR
jgi:glycosyltransferase involved in cell wall biosynthesis